MANSEYISILKRKIKTEISKDSVIVKAFGSPNYDETDLDWSGEDVSQNYIFTWNKNPKTITDTITFITIQVNIRRYKNNWVTTQLIITIFTHDKHMKLDLKEFPGVSANRNDYISQLIDNKFNGKTYIGDFDDPDRISLFGKLELSANGEGMVNDTFAYRQLIFDTKDLNYSLCENGE